VTTIHLARHGETDWNRELRWQGHSDVALNARGREQARSLAAAVAGMGFAAVYSSDLRRAAETAELVAERLQLPVRMDPGLRELDIGSWEGFTLAELDSRVPHAVARWERDREQAWEGGESHEEMAARVLEAIRTIAARHNGEEVLVVSHGGPIRALKVLAAGFDYPTDRFAVTPTDHCEVCVIAVRDGAVRRID
jgi:broad specificity phosphatase PhoE